MSAGAILNSSLVFSGWKPPIVNLIDSDDKYLFDLEVRVKLNHSDSSQQLLDALSDFPPEVFLQRVGLMQSLFNILGSTRLSSEGGYCLDPCSVLDWYYHLFQGLIRSFGSMIDGSKCVRLSEFDESDDLGVATGMARAILLMRYPQSSSVTSDDKQATRTSSGVETVPHPSLSGLSFALCAASLPLLRCRDMVLSAKVHQLLRLVVKLVPEVSFSFCELSSDINDLNVKRFQYLLNRVEQLLTGIQPLTLPHFEDLKEKDSVSNRIRLLEDSFNLTLIRVVTLVLDECPRQWLQSQGPGISECQDPQFSIRRPFLQVGKETITVLESLNIATSNPRSVFVQTVGSVTASVLQKIEWNQQRDITSTRQLWENILWGHQLLASNFVDTFSAKDLNTSIVDVLRSVSSVFTAEIVESSEVMAKVHSDLNISTLVVSLLLWLWSTDAASVEVSVRELFSIFSSCDESSKLNILSMLLMSFSSESDLLIDSVVDMATSLCEHLEIDGLSTDLIRERLNADSQRIKELGTATGSPIIANFGRPANFYSLVLFYLQSTCSVSMQSCLCSSILMVMIDLVSKHLMTNDSEINIDSYFCLLSPFVAVRWTCGNHHIPNFLQFLKIIKDNCSSSLSPTAQSMHWISVLLGIFHKDTTVRCENFKLISHAINRKNGSPTRSAQYTVNILSELSSVRAHVVDIDPLRWIPIHELSSLDLRAKEHFTDVGRQTFQSIFTHSDARKLASISFGSCEQTIRSSSLAQLTSLLCDEHIVSTADHAWCLDVADKCIFVLKDFQQVLSAATSDAGLGASSAMSTLNESLTFVFQVVRLLKLLVYSLKWLRVKCIVVFDASSPSNFLNICDLAEIALVSPKVASLGDLLDDIRALCIQILFAVAVDTSSWDRNGNGHIVFKSCSSDRELVPPESELGIRVPLFLKSKLLCALSLQCEKWNSRLEVNSGVRWISFAYPDISPSEKIPRTDLLINIWFSMCKPISTELIPSLATYVVDCMSDARSHVDFRDCVAVAICLGENIRDETEPFQFFCALIEAGISSPISRILSVCPSNQRDYATLEAVLELSIQLIFSIQQRILLSNVSSVQAEALVGIVFDALSEGLLPVFMERLPLNHSLQPSDKSKPAICSIRVQLGLFRLWSSLIDLRVQWQSRDTIFALKSHPIIRLFVQMSCNELWATCVRVQALAVVEKLILFQDGIEVMPMLGMQVDPRGKYSISGQSVSSSYNSSQDTSSQCSSLELLMTVVRMLRTPDSMLRSGQFIGSLRCVFVCVHMLSTSPSIDSKSVTSLVFFSSEWKWLLRLLYDRRADVKCLILQICKVLITFDDFHAFEWASRTHESSEDSEGSMSLFDFVDQILWDQSESGLVRVSALDLLLEWYLVLKQKHRYQSDDELDRSERDEVTVLERKIVSGATDILDCRGRYDVDVYHPRLLRSAVLALIAVLKEVQSASDSVRVMGIFLDLKVVPILVQMMHSDIFELFGQAALNRIGLSSDHPITSASFTNTQLQHQSGWQTSIAAAELDIFAQLDITQGFISKFIRLVGSVDGEVFDHTLRHTNLFPNLISRISNLNIQVSFETISCHLDLLGVLILRDLRQSSSIESKPIYLKNLIDGNAIIPMSVLTSVNGVLIRCLDICLVRREQSIQAIIHILFSVLKLIVLIFDDCVWFDSLGFNDTDGVLYSPASQTLTYLLSLRRKLLSFQLSSENVHSASRDLIISRIDVILAIVSSKSTAAKNHISRCSTEVGEGQPVVIDCIECLRSVVSSLKENKKPLQTLKQGLQKTRASSASRWRGSVRGYSVSASIDMSIAENRSDQSQVSEKSKSSIKSKMAAKSIQINEKIKMRLWSCLTVLVGLLRNNVESQRLCCELGFSESLSSLVGYSVAWSIATLQSSSNYRQHSDYSETLIIPTDGQLAAAVFSVVSSFTANSQPNKASMSKCGESRISWLQSDSGSTSSQATPALAGNSLHQLLSIGMNKTLVSSVRWLGLNLVGSIALADRSASTSQKNALSSLIASEIRSILQSPQSLDRESVFFLLEAWTACIVSSGMCVPGLSHSNELHSRKKEKSSTKTNEDVSIPELLSWTMERSASNVGVMSSIVRSIGCFSIGSSLPNVVDAMDTNSLIDCSQNHPAQRRLLANAAHDTSVDILVDVFVKSGESATNLQLIAAVALWSVVHKSEQVRSVVKRMGALALVDERLASSRHNPTMCRMLAAIKDNLS